MKKFVLLVWLAGTLAFGQAVERTGSTFTLSSNTQDDSVAVTVPADADICIVVLGYNDEDAVLDALSWDGGNTMDFTVIKVYDAGGTRENQAAYYMKSSHGDWPATNATLYRNHAAALSEGSHTACFFYKNVGISGDPIIDVEWDFRDGAGWMSNPALTGVGADDMGIAIGCSKDPWQAETAAFGETTIWESDIYNGNSFGVEDELGEDALLISLAYGGIVGFALSAGETGPPPSANVWVDGDLGSDCTSDDYDSTDHDCSGDEGNAYDTVAEAVAAVAADGVITIRGASGGFDGSYESAVTITIDKNLTLEAYGSEEPVIHGTHVPDESGNWQTFHVSTGDVTFDGLEIHGTRNAFDEDYGHVGILGTTSGRVTIDNCEIHSYNHCGIKGNSKLTMTDSYIYDIGTSGDIWNDHAIYWYRNGSLGDVVFDRNRFDGITGAAFHFYNAGNACGPYIVRYNTMIGGSVNGSTSWGILLSCSNCLIYNNSIYDCDVAIQFFRDACDYNVVSNNAMYGSGVNGDFAVDTCGGGCTCGANNTASNNYFGSVPPCSDCTGDQADLDDAPPNIINTDNPFVAVPDTWDDFRLAVGSGAIDEGNSALGAAHKWGFDPSDTTWPPSILDQDLFGVEWEIGAFVYEENGAPAPPHQIIVINDKELK